MAEKSSKPKSGLKFDGPHQRKKSNSEGIFSELDKQPKRFSGFWVFLIFILLLIFVGLIYFATEIKRLHFSTSEITNSRSTSDSLRERLKIIAAYGQTTLAFNSDQFAEISGVGSGDFPLSNPTFNFAKNQIILSGRLKNSLIFWPINLQLSASAVAGKYQFLLSPNATENIVVAGDRKTQIESRINDSINSAMEKEGFAAGSVNITAGEIDLTVIKKP